MKVEFVSRSTVRHSEPIKIVCTVDKHDAEENEICHFPLTGSNESVYAADILSQFIADMLNIAVKSVDGHRRYEQMQHDLRVS